MADVVAFEPVFGANFPINGKLAGILLDFGHLLCVQEQLVAKLQYVIRIAIKSNIGKVFWGERD